MMDRQGIATAILSMVMWTAMFAAKDDAAAARPACGMVAPHRPVAVGTPV